MQSLTSTMDIWMKATKQTTRTLNSLECLLPKWQHFQMLRRSCENRVNDIVVSPNKSTKNTRIYRGKRNCIYAQFNDDSYAELMFERTPKHTRNARERNFEWAQLANEIEWNVEATDRKSKTKDEQQRRPLSLSPYRVADDKFQSILQQTNEFILLFAHEICIWCWNSPKSTSSMPTPTSNISMTSQRKRKSFRFVFTFRTFHLSDTNIYN